MCIFDVAMLQRPLNRFSGAVLSGLFAYNGRPTIAVAKKIVGSGRVLTRRALFSWLFLLIQLLEARR